MARARNIKPGFFKDEDLADSCSRDARLLFAGLWTIADCQGLLEFKPRWIKSEIFPYDDDIGVAEIEDMVWQLSSGGFVKVYESEDQKYIWVVHFLRHQHVNSKELMKGSRYPDPKSSTVIILTGLNFSEPVRNFSEPVGTFSNDLMKVEVLKDEGMNAAEPQRIPSPSDSVDVTSNTTCTDVTARAISRGATPTRVAPVTTNTRYDAAMFAESFDFEEFFEAVYARHPRKGYRSQALAAIGELMIAKTVTPEKFDELHAKQCESEEWTWMNGAKAPHLFQWVADRGYRYVSDPPSAAKEKREHPRLMM